MTTAQFVIILWRCIIVAFLSMAALPAVAQISPAVEPEKNVQDPPAPAPAEEATGVPSLFGPWRVQFETGARNFDLYGDRPGKFFETRDVTRGVYVRRLQLNLVSGDSPFLVSFRASDIRELDETVKADIWRIGRFRTTFLWDRIPRFYSEGTSLFHAASPGLLTVSPAIRGAFQANVDGQNPPDIPPALFPLVRAELAAAPVSDLRIRHDQAGLRQSFRFGHWRVHFGARTTFQRGARPKGAGTFARQNIAPAGDGVWESIGVELPEPVNYRATDIFGGIMAAGARWRIGVDYNLTLFRNNVTTLTYENPFRVTNAAGNPPGGGAGRNRFVSQQLALPPDSDHHRVTVTGGVDLPRNTELRALVSWSETTQNDAFLPFTLNPALAGSAPGLANNLPPGTSPLTVSSLPQLSLNGAIRDVNYDSTLASRPWKGMDFRVQYRAEDMKNKSPRLVFPGFSRFGESHWVTSVDYYGVPIENFPTSFVRQDVSASWRWSISPRVTWKAEYLFETWKRTYRDVPHTYEHSINGELDMQLTRNLTFKGNYLYGDRDPDLYKTVPMTFNAAANLWEVTAGTRYERGVPLEFSQLRRFDETGRIRQDGRAALDYHMADKITLSASSRYVRDNYMKGFYGLQFDEQASVDGEVTFTPGERTFLYVNYSRQLDRYRYLDLGHLIIGSVVNGNPCCAQYPIANTWDRNSRNTLNSAQAGVNWASNGEKTVLDLSYGLSFSKDRIHTFNPFTIRPDSPRTAGAYNYPDTLNRYHEVFLTLTRKLMQGLDLGLEYKFEAYQLDDFYLNALQPYAYGLVTAGGLVTNLQRQLLLNARFTTYHAHQEGFFLRYNF